MDGYADWHHSTFWHFQFLNPPALEHTLTGKIRLRHSRGRDWGDTDNKTFSRLAIIHSESVARRGRQMRLGLPEDC